MSIKLKELKIKNFRRIENLNISIPENKNVICFVGNNGSGKSSVLSFLVKSLVEMTTEKIKDNEGDNEIFRTLITSEIKNGRSAYGLKINWNSNDLDRIQNTIVKTPGIDNDETKEIATEFGIDYGNEWYSQNWIPQNNITNDVISKSILLYRPSNRFELPSYESQQIRVVDPTLQLKWDNERFVPVKVSSGLKEIERLLLDLVIDRSIAPGEPDKYITKFINFIKEIHPDYKTFGIPSWPYRKIGVGFVNDLASLSSGELDLIVTAGNILSQEIYLKRKHGILEANGIVIIDELATNLHPSLQEMAIPLLTKHFPNIQFIVTTHSPFVIRSLNKAKSIIIRLPDGSQFEDDFNYWWIEDILNSVFEVNGGSSESVMNLLELFESQIIKYPNETSKEEILNVYNQLNFNSTKLSAKLDRLIALYGDNELIEILKKNNDHDSSK